MTYIPVPPFRFIEAREGYSRYDDSNGEPCYFANRTFNTGPTHSYYGPVAGSGVNELTFDMALEAGEIDGLNFEETRALVPAQWRDDLHQCVKCDQVAHRDETTNVDGTPWCESCVNVHNNEECGRCGETVTAFYGVGDEDVACTSCSENYTHYCDSCGQTVWTDSYHHEYHEDEDCGCEAPHQNFSIAGSDTVRYENDEFYTVSVEGGVVRDDGMDAIRNLIFDWYVNGPGKGTITGAMRTQVSNALIYMDPVYKNSEGVFAKRFRSAVYKRTKKCVEANRETDPTMYGDTPVSIKDDLLAQIGTLAREYSSDFEVKVSITRDLNQEADDFGHEDSCWWTDYAYSRCSFKSNAGFGLRTWHETPYGHEVTGRVWVIPCTVGKDSMGRNRLYPTLGEAEAYAVFNGYGDLEENAGPQVLAALTGMSVSAIRYDFSPGRMYVNGQTCRIVAPADVLALDLLRAPYDLPQHGALLEPVEAELLDPPAAAAPSETVLSDALVASIIESNPAPDHPAPDHSVQDSQVQMYAAATGYTGSVHLTAGVLDLPGVLSLPRTLD